MRLTSIEIVSRDRESTLSSFDGYGVQKEGQEESKIQKEIETVVVERVRGQKEYTKGVNNKSDGSEV